MGYGWSDLGNTVTSGIGGLIGIGDSRSQKRGMGGVGAAGAAAQEEIRKANADAQARLNIDKTEAAGKIGTGFQTAANAVRTGMGNAHNEYQQGGQEAVNTAKQGFDEAKDVVENSPNMVQSRQDIYKRLIGEGGLDENTVNKMEGKVREEYGTGLRGAQTATSQFLGGSQAQGLAGEELGRVATALGTERANSVRDIETQNEVLKRTEMTDAIKTAQADAYQEAGLDVQSAEYVSGLQAKLAEGGANLTAQEAQALSTLAAQEGVSTADLITKFSQAGATLTMEEAQALANIGMGTATNIAQIGMQPHGLLGLLGENI
jgi:hypothetical protein